VLASTIRGRGMVFYRVLELAVAHDPVRYKLQGHHRHKAASQGAAHTAKGTRAAPSLDRPLANRPWREAARDDSG